MFTYIFPLAIINWIPAKALLTGEITGLALAAPVIGWLFFGLGAIVWKIGGSRVYEYGFVEGEA